MITFRSLYGNYFDTAIEYLKGVGPKRAEVLQKELGIFRFHDLLHYFPFRYVDRTKFYKVTEIHPDLSYVQLRGKLKNLEVITAKGRQSRMRALFYDGSGMMELVWFSGIKWLQESLRPDTEYIVFGKPSYFNGKLSMAHPELETAGDTTLRTGFQPVYNSTEKARAAGFDSKGIFKLVRTLFENYPGEFEENLPVSVTRPLRLVSHDTAIRNVHLPSQPDEMQNARLRLKFEELFFVQMQLLKLQGIRKKNLKGFIFEKIDKGFDAFYHQHLPFPLTNAQKRVIKEIRKDVLSGVQMNRLLQGDVGSGKTIVALLTMLMAVDNGLQAALIAPTEILAQQHFTGITDLLKNMDVTVGLLTGSVKKAERTKLHAGLQDGSLKILIGTHAVLEETVDFRNLGIAVIDEQHRFGVVQRATLWKKNREIPPHILVMTATPIPRTLAMTLYGDLDVSVIDELPPGRKPIRTIHRFDFSRQKVYDLMQEELSKGRQIYIVYPLIAESEKLDYKNLLDGYDQIREAFKGYHVSIVHGKMKADAKDFEMQRFVTGETHIMVATTVIEVGVNVPNASVMIIESAEKFGLSQLHQLRGRVGRGAEQSFCVLVTSPKLGEDSRIRMDTMVRTNDGFEISEVDLKLRGPGDLEGTRQSGMLNFKIADLTKDQKILHLARDAAKMLMEQDPDLEKPENQQLLKELQRSGKGKTNWSRIS